MTITIKQLKEYIAEDVLCHFLCDIDYDFGDCVIADKNDNDVLLKSIIEKDEYPHYNLYTLFVDNPNNYENGKVSSDYLCWSIWEPYEHEDDEGLKRLMDDMFKWQVDTWTDRLKLENK